MKNSSQAPIAITGIGMITSVGHDAKTACASMRAGLKRPVKLKNFYADSRKGYDEWEDGLVTGHPVLGGNCDETEGRICTLLVSAIEDVVADAGLDECCVVPLYLALPGKERALFSEESMDVYISENATLFPHIGEVVTFPTGHSAGIMALDSAIAAIRAGICGQAIVAGVDSLIGFRDLARFNRGKRLKTEDNSDGFIPGEAAAAILVETISHADGRGGTIQGVVNGVSTGFGVNHVLAGGNPGSGLSDTVAALFPTEDNERAEIRAIITDLNGEPHRFDEVASLHARVFSRMGGEKELICPARNTGDTGAASGCVAIGLAVRTLIRGGFGKTGSHCLVLSSSDSGERGALLITPNTLPTKGVDHGRHGRSE